MNLKDRLKHSVKIQKPKVETSKLVQYKDESFVSDIFVKDENAEKILAEILSTNNNVIFASSVECENVIISQYLKTHLPVGESVETIFDVNSNIKFVNSSKIIFSNPNIKEFVKVLEFILYGYKNFIFGINVCQYENIIETIKTLILVNNPNLSEKTFNTLVGTSHPIIVYFKKNTDGLFYVSNIGKIIGDNDSLELEEVYSFVQQPEQEIVQETLVEEKTVAIDLDEVNAEDVIIVDESIKEDDIVVTEEIKYDLKEEESEPVTKNKYKLLKEKIKRKKQQL